MYSFAEYLFWFYDLDSYSVRYLQTSEIEELFAEYQNYVASQATPHPEELETEELETEELETVQEVHPLFRFIFGKS